MPRGGNDHQELLPIYYAETGAERPPQINAGLQHGAPVLQTRCKKKFMAFFFSSHTRTGKPLFLSNPKCAGEQAALPGAFSTGDCSTVERTEIFANPYKLNWRKTVSFDTG